MCMCVTVCEQRRQGSWGHTYTHSHPMWQQTCNQCVNTHRLLALSLGCMAVCCGLLQKTTHLAGHTQCDVSAGAPPVQHRDQDSLDAAACGVVTAATNTTAHECVPHTAAGHGLLLSDSYWACLPDSYWGHATPLPCLTRLRVTQRVNHPAPQLLSRRCLHPACLPPAPTALRSGGVLSQPPCLTCTSPFCQFEDQLLGPVLGCHHLLQQQPPIN